MSTKSGVLLNVLFVMVVAGLTASAAGAVESVDPQQHLQNVRRNPNLYRYDGEHFAWHAGSAAGGFLDAFEATGNAEWLQAAADYYDFYIEELEEDPDGNLGWIGEPVGGSETLRIDALVGDAILLREPLRFAELVLNDPELEERFGEKAREYVELAVHIGWEKWNERETYNLDQGYGSYHTPLRYICAENWEWVERPSRVISDNLNKHYAMGIVLLRLHRITGEEQYAQRVFEIFSRLKSMFRLLDDEDERISWNFWMPHGPYDIEGRSPTSWVAVHPNRAGYQAGEVGRIVEVYDSGLVFDEDDIRRLINTNHWMDRGDGSWRSSDGTSDAGTLWRALARFDDRIYEARLGALQDNGNDRNRIQKAYLERVHRPLGWERRYVGDETSLRIYDREPEPGRYISMNQVIPGTIELAANDRAILATQVRGSGELSISLVDADTDENLGTIHRERVDGDGARYVMPRWDGTNPDTGEKEVGEYLAEWNFRGETRRQRLSVIVGEERDDPDAPEVLQPGEELAIDFSEEPDPRRWQLEGAARSDEIARSGERSLRMGAGETARLYFGAGQDLPVRISMWVHEEGVRRPDATGGEGPRWGTITEIGDILAMRIAWRGYLAGDSSYAWTNTGENRWFNLRNARVPRQEGWNEWVFDFTDPDNPTITGGGRAANISGEWMPEGAVGIYLRGSDTGGPLYVDDIVIEYPAP